jgi:ATP-binding cassette subfamily F protein 3
MSLLGVCQAGFAWSCGSNIFEDASFSINPGDRMAIVGANGAGKSTLLRLLSGEQIPTSGEIVRRRPLITAVAGLDASSASTTTLFDFVFGALKSLTLLRDILRQLEAKLSDPNSACEYSARINEYEESGGYAAEARIAAILDGIGFRDEDLDRRIETLSGGERTRAGLAHALSMESDLLILDEPTNHLDIAAREWLGNHLQARQNATVLTSHDRELLSRFADRIIEIERGRVRLFEGGYAEYRESRALLDRQAWDAWSAFERRRQVVEQAADRRDKLARRVETTPEDGSAAATPFYKRKAGKVARTARILRERVSDEKRVDKPWEEQPIDRLSFEGVPRGGDIVVSAQGLEKAYGGRTLFRDLSFTVGRGDRLVIRGGNGSGKTTLLNLILGRTQPDSGSIRFGAGGRIASVDQQPDGVELELSPLEICGAGTNARTLLACLRLRPENLNRPLRELSGGERTKVALARVLNNGANLLLLDEPTNHLEIEAQEALEAALLQYPGALILVSHDRSFLRNIGKEAKYVELEEDEVRPA